MSACVQPVPLSFFGGRFGATCVCLLPASNARKSQRAEQTQLHNLQAVTTILPALTTWLLKGFLPSGSGNAPATFWYQRALATEARQSCSAGAASNRVFMTTIGCKSLPAPGGLASSSCLWLADFHCWPSLTVQDDNSITQLIQSLHLALYAHAWCHEAAHDKAGQLTIGRAYLFYSLFELLCACLVISIPLNADLRQASLSKHVPLMVCLYKFVLRSPTFAARHAERKPPFTEQKVKGTRRNVLNGPQTGIKTCHLAIQPV